MAVVVFHPLRIAAEAIAGALSRRSGLAAVGVASSADELELASKRADAVVVCEGGPDAASVVSRMRARGLHVVTVGDASRDRGGLSAEASIDSLAGALRPPSGPADVPRLTAREREVLALVRCGLAGKQVARRLGISPKTVERHKTRIYTKLGVPNQAAAVWMTAFDHQSVGEGTWIRSTI